MQFHRDNIGPEWQDLVNEFPEIFLEPSEEVLVIFKHYGGGGCDFPATLEECCNLRLGFECGIGWKNIIRKFCEQIRDLQNFAKNNGHEIHYKTFILKEKFGGLRDQGDFYGQDSDLYRPLYRHFSNQMEEESLVTCEMTGKPGSLCVSSSGRTVQTLSDEESQKLGFEPSPSQI